MGDKIPFEMDELLWRVAEARDADLTADFLRRYPTMQPQLSTRQAMVDSMRAARPVPPIATRFAPSAARASRSKLWLAPLAAGLLLGLAIASYQVVKFSRQPTQPGRTTIVVPQSPVPTPKDGRVVGPTPADNFPHAPGTGPRPDDTRTDDGLVVLKAEGTSLFAAIAAIRKKGVTVEIMPGLEDMPLKLTPNRDDGTFALEPLAMLHAVKAAAGFELVDGGPDGFMALPSERTTVIGGESERVRRLETDGN